AHEPRGIAGAARQHDAQARAVREDALAALAVIRRPAAQVAAVRGADHDWTRPRVVRAVAHVAQLVPYLHHRRPDVVEELDLHDGLEAQRGEAYRATHDVGFRQRRVVDALGTEELLQAPGDAEDAAL